MPIKLMPGAMMCCGPFPEATWTGMSTREKKDHMETFFLAETMKYLYLVFANPDGINPDACVFSTEAHPFWK
jgi:hypothetical protein